MKLNFCLLLLVLFVGNSVQARFGYPETQTVPIDRVMTNLQRRLAQGSNQVETLYYLARVHSEAYAVNPSTLKVNTRNLLPWFPVDSDFPKPPVNAANSQEAALAHTHLTNAISLYQQAAKILVSHANPESQWLILPTHLGLAWCLDQSGKKAEAIKGYRLALEIAWNVEVEKGPQYFGEQIDMPWDQFRAKHALKTGARDFVTLHPGKIYSEEIIGYLLKLLDPVKDAKEIEQLKKDVHTLDTAQRMITPLMMPLEPGIDFEQLVDTSANVAFDLDGSGLPRRWRWITPKAGWIVYDLQGSGVITSGLQMFGGVTFWVFWRDGYEALRSLDDDGDGKLSGKELRGISVWQDINGNGVSDPGEVRPITVWGVVEIDCGRERDPSGMPFNPKGVVFGNGSMRPTFDWMVPSAP